MCISCHVVVRWFDDGRGKPLDADSTGPVVVQNLEGGLCLAVDVLRLRWCRFFLKRQKSRWVNWWQVTNGACDLQVPLRMLVFCEEYQFIRDGTFVAIYLSLFLKSSFILCPREHIMPSVSVVMNIYGNLTLTTSSTFESSSPLELRRSDASRPV